MDIQKIKDYMRQKGITYADLANMSGLSVSTITKIMGGFARYPRVDTVQAIEKALGLNDSSKDWTAEERAAGVVDSVKVSVTAQEYNLLDMFREIGRTKGADKQQIIIELLEILLKF